MNNSTTQSTLDTTSVIYNSVYAIQGILMVAGNVVVFLTIVTGKALRRKEMYIIAALGLAECLYGLSQAVNAINRLSLLMQLKDKQLVPGYTCAMSVEAIGVIVAPQVCYLLLLLISFDRFIAIQWFATYMKLGKRYTKGLIGGVFGFAVVSITTLCLTSYFFYPRDRMVSVLCTIGSISEYQWFNVVFREVCSIGSVLTYALVMIAYWRQGRTLKGSVQNAHLKRQRRLTKTLGFCSLVTFFFLVVPNTLQLAWTDPRVAAVLTPVVFMLTPFNCMSNFFFFALKHEDFRKQLKIMFRYTKTKVTSVQMAGNMNQMPASSNSGSG